MRSPLSKSSGRSPEIPEQRKIAISEAQRHAIAADPRWRGGHYPADVPPAAGLAAARTIAMFSYRSRESLDARFGRERAASDRYAVEAWVDHHGRALIERIDANTYVALTRAMDTHDRLAHEAGRGPDFARQDALSRLLDIRHRVS